MVQTQFKISLFLFFTKDPCLLPFNFFSSRLSSVFSRSKETGAYDLGELDQALFLYLEGQDHASAQDQRRKFPSLDLFV